MNFPSPPQATRAARARALGFLILDVVVAIGVAVRGASEVRVVAGLAGITGFVLLLRTSSAVLLTTWTSEGIRHVGIQGASVVPWGKIEGARDAGATIFLTAGARVLRVRVADFHGGLRPFLRSTLSLGAFASPTDVKTPRRRLARVARLATVGVGIGASPFIVELLGVAHATWWEYLAGSAILLVVLAELVTTEFDERGVRRRPGRSGRVLWADVRGFSIDGSKLWLVLLNGTAVLVTMEAYEPLEVCEFVQQQCLRNASREVPVREPDGTARDGAADDRG